MERFEMLIEAELLARIDKAKGLAKRATWIKDVLARELDRLEKASGAGRPQRPRKVKED